MLRTIYESEDTLKCADILLKDSSLVDFWKWGLSDVCEDDLKGIFAEWIVMKLLSIPGNRRISWANSDLVTQEGVRIEVKASSYWQSWQLMDDPGLPHVSPLHAISIKTRITFGGPNAQGALEFSDGGPTPKLKSDIYIFALQHEIEAERWNAMDLSQWEFYVLPAQRLSELGWKSISLNMLRIEQEPVSAAALAQAVNRLIEDRAKEIQSADAVQG